MYKESITDPSAFWSAIASEFYWKKEWDPANIVQGNFDTTKGPISTSFFSGAQTNIAWNCLDAQISKGRGDTAAFVWEGNGLDENKTMSYSEVCSEVNKLANWLRNIGVKKGDRVIIYMPMIPELPISMLACARIGAVHGVVFAGFSAESLAQRIIDSEAKIILTCNAVLRGTKLLDLKSIVDSAIGLGGDGCRITHCLCVANERAVPFSESNFILERDFWWKETVEKMSSTCETEWVDAEDALFMLYTSGSTGKPKGVVHTTGGYMVYAATTTKYVFDLKPGDLFWCTADCGWITGHTYVTYGPLLNGATSLVFEGVPNYPDPGRCWEIVDKFGVQVFYTAPTLIRSLQREGDDYVKKYSRSSLRLLGTVGEPINPEAWKWYYEVVGNSQSPIVDTWWQTETGGILISPQTGAIKLKPGSASKPFYGIEPVIVNKEGKVLEGECEGMLCINRSWPGQMRTVYGDHQRFIDTYFSQFDGKYFTGDGCRRDVDGYYWITGRVDDVIIVSGHNLGTAEIESAFVSHSKVSEAAVVGYPHDIKGNGLYCYVSLKVGEEYTEDLKEELKQVVRKKIGPIATPDMIHFTAGLPKTRSGKIMRRILRKIAANEHDQLGDTTTLADPSVVDDLVNNRLNK